MTFSLPSSYLDLKVPINHDDDNSNNAKEELVLWVEQNNSSAPASGFS